ncbi:efflux RND transporter permease subunit [Pigmentibacter ruber]|uniref:efflux RND transporter permease subunit n=1 Tax=Pigmentibacter ruber TaxID=2683196 RepID=UPI00131CB615|nr:efflux RND transporter permease subunit [Pigmentibacter ruber]
MWIIELALKRPYTIAVGVILTFIVGFISISKMLVDIFPVIDIPVVNIIWNYPGLTPNEVEKRVIFLAERAYTTTVNGISKLESTSIQGLGIQRIYFEEGTDIGSAISQISAVSGTVTRIMPPGITPPVILKFNASNVPVAQLTLFSDKLKEEQIYDYATNFLRVQLYTIPGISLPAPYGGKQRQINIDLIPELLEAKKLSPQNIVDSLQASNIIVPAGNARIHNYEYNILMNSSPLNVKEFNDIPIKVINGAAVTLGNIAKVSDSFAEQTNIVRINGARASYLNILKKAQASTLNVIQSIKSKLPEISNLAPPELNMQLDFDQSFFVKSAIQNVLLEAVISSILVSTVILVFLGSWRSVIIVCTSIPTAIFCSLIVLYLTGNSINIMTMGGLSLAIGMLVDDATVAIENIHRIRNQNNPLIYSIMEGSRQIALPALSATLVICIVFFPIILLTGPAKYLFAPLALAVVSAMLASYILSRTLVPLLAKILLKNEREHGNLNFSEKFNKLFLLFQDKFGEILSICLKYRKFVLINFFIFLILSSSLIFFVGTDFFPQTDAGIIKLHYRARPGTRIEETENQVRVIETKIREIIPKNEIQTINSMIGIPVSFNLAFVQTDNFGPMDAEILISFQKEHENIQYYMKKIRKMLANTFPESEAFFQPADIVNQVLNFGLSAPIDIQIEAQDLSKSIDIAKKLLTNLKLIPGLEDIALKQVLNYPGLFFNIDRIKAAQVGISQRDISNSLLIALSSSSLISPSYYLNPNNNVNYSVIVKTPLEKISNLDHILNIPITSNGNILESNLTSTYMNQLNQTQQTAQTIPLRNLSTIQTIETMTGNSHLNVQRVLDIYGTPEGRDLGAIIKDIEYQIKKLGELPKGVKVTINGQGKVMREAFSTLGIGLILAIILVYLLIAVLFQSWLDPFIVMVAVPGALSGILWILFLTGTTINVESFMGATMAVGIASSNSILLVSYANDLRVSNKFNALEAALESAKTRLRPVLMTAIAMIIGMLPAALAIGEGGEQTAPLGRAVIGGLIVATTVTLIVVPIIYSLLRKNMPKSYLLDEELRKEKLIK